MESVSTEPLVERLILALFSDEEGFKNQEEEEEQGRRKERRELAEEQTNGRSEVVD